jgi:hypothetical protein
MCNKSCTVCYILYFIVVSNKHLCPLPNFYAVEFNILDVPVHNDFRVVQTFLGLEKSLIVIPQETEAIMPVAICAQDEVMTDPTFSDCGPELSSDAVVTPTTYGSSVLSCQCS